MHSWSSVLQWLKELLCVNEFNIKWIFCSFYLVTSSSVMSLFWRGLTSFWSKSEKTMKLSGWSTCTLANSDHCARVTDTALIPHWTRCCVNMVSAAWQNSPFHWKGSTWNTTKMIYWFICTCKQCIPAMWKMKICL